MHFIVSIVPVRLLLWISGVLASGISSAKNFSEYRRQQIPALVRPARPDLCAACDLLMSTVTSVSIPVAASWRFSFAFPVSMTNEMFGTVRLVSAMFVAMTILRIPSSRGRLRSWSPPSSRQP